MIRHHGRIPGATLDNALAVGAGKRMIEHLVTGRADGRTQQAVVRDMQRHPYRPVIMHIDFMRVSAEEVLRMSVPLHFVGEEKSPAGKASGVVIQHQVTDVEIAALPKDLPEFLSVDLSKMDAGDVVMLSDIILPEGVTIPALSGAGEHHDMPVANAVHVKADQGTGAAAAAEAEAALADELGEIPAEEAGEEASEEAEEGGEQET
jgi:large subunit ribosomal protein L25